MPILCLGEAKVKVSMLLKYLHEIYRFLLSTWNWLLHSENVS